jgi:nickel transport protein
MRTWRRAAWCAAAMLPVIGGELAAHGISVVVERTGDAWVVTARYDGGVPMAGADVVIHGPGAESVYQEGRTDPGGRFVFMPSGPGEWRVRVDDGMGHRRTVRTMVQAADPTLVGAEPDWTALTGSVAADGGTGPWRFATGLSLLLGLTGFAYGFSARSRRGSDPV